MSNKKVLNTKEKMIKSCNFASKVILVLECIMGLGAVLLIVFGILLGVAIMNSPLNDNLENTYEESTEIIENSQNLYIDEEPLDNSLSDIIRFISAVVILDMIRRVLRNTAKDETPFSLANLRKIEVIDICVFISWISLTTLISIELIYMILISSIYLIFKYGYELQLESDETL